MNPEKDFLAALDLGSTLTRVLVAEVCDADQGASPLRFVGFGEAESRGWRKGAVADLDAVAGSVRKAVEQAEAQMGAAVESALAVMALLAAMNFAVALGTCYLAVVKGPPAQSETP